MSDLGPPVVNGSDTEVVEVIESQSALLNCDVSGTEPLDIEWQRDKIALNLQGIRGEHFLQVRSNGVLF